MINISLTKTVVAALSSIFLITQSFAGAIDPLSPSELDNALLISTTELATSQTTVSRRSNNTPTPITEPELLLIERRRQDKEAGTQRLADVYHYNYQTNQTIHTVVDLETQQVLSTEQHQYLQLPLTENELQRSSDIIFSDPEQAVLIGNEYQRITGQYLSSPEQLNIKAFAFSADTLPEQLNPASQQCGLHRCAQVLLYTHDSIVFEISPIVNLSAGIVTQNIGY